MAGRPTKQGLEYFPFDVDFFNDEKIEFVSARFGAKGEIITVRLMCKIYRIGYFTEWNEDESTLLAKRAGNNISPALVSEVVNELVRRRFFDESILNRFGILTSKGIQRRYVRATSDRKEVEIIRDYWLVDWPKNATKINLQPINSINPPINSINPPINAQSKVKESKGKERLSLSDSLSHRDSEIAPPTAAQRERENFLEILFFDKELLSPQNELDRFLSHYEKSGWLDANGNPVKNKIAALKNWNPDKNAVKCRSETVKLWRKVYDAIGRDAPGDNREIMLTHFRGMSTDSSGVISLVVDMNLAEWLEQPAHVKAMRNALIDTEGADKRIFYRVPKN